MKFENTGLDWLKESDEDDNLLADDELDLVEEEMNEGLYVDPSNYDKHSDLVDVVDKQGNPQKMTQATYDKNKDSGEFEKKEPEEKDKDAAISKQRVIQNVPNIREGLKMLERDAELSKNYSDFGPSNDMNSGNYIAKNNETGRYEVVGHYNTDNTVTVFANNKKEEPKENKDSGEFEKKEPEEDKQPEKAKDDKELQHYLDQDYGKFDDIPNRNNVDWKTVPDSAKSDYERLTIQLFNKKKAHDSFAYSVVKSTLDNNLDGAVIDWIKGHMQETPEIAQALKEFDDALQEKDLSKSWKAYQNLWDVHRNATKRKQTKKSDKIKDAEPKKEPKEKEVKADYDDYYGRDGRSSYQGRSTANDYDDYYGGYDDYYGGQSSSLINSVDYANHPDYQEAYRTFVNNYLDSSNPAYKVIYRTANGEYDPEDLDGSKKDAISKEVDRLKDSDITDSIFYQRLKAAADHRDSGYNDYYGGGYNDYYGGGYDDYYGGY